MSHFTFCVFSTSLKNLKNNNTHDMCTLIFFNRLCYSCCSCPSTPTHPTPTSPVKKEKAQYLFVQTWTFPKWVTRFRLRARSVSPRTDRTRLVTLTTRACGRKLLVVFSIGCVGSWRVRRAANHEGCHGRRGGKGGKHRCVCRGDGSGWGPWCSCCWVQVTWMKKWPRHNVKKSFIKEKNLQRKQYIFDRTNNSRSSPRGYIVVGEARLVIKLASFFATCFCSPSLLFVGLYRAQNTKGIEMQMNNKPIETFEFTRKTKLCARSRFVQHKTKHFCILPLKFVELPNQLVLWTMVSRTLSLIRVSHENMRGQRVTLLVMGLWYVIVTKVIYRLACKRKYVFRDVRIKTKVSE